MQNSPCRVIAVSDVRQIVISVDPSEGAIVEFEVPGEANLELKLPAPVIAKLEGLLAGASMTQAKYQPKQ